jgi:hypothetical protein
MVMWCSAPLNLELRRAYGCQFDGLLHNHIFEAIAKVLLRSDRAEVSSRDDLILYHMQADDAWLRVLSKMTGHRFTEHAFQLVH